MHVDATGLEPDSEYHYRFGLGEFTTPPRADAHLRRAGDAARSVPVRLLVVPELGAGLVRRLPRPRRAGRRRRLRVPRRLHLRVREWRIRRRPRPRRPGRTSSARRSSSTASGTRCTTATRSCRRPTRSVPWIVTWDDHEVDNDYAGDVSEQDDDPRGLPHPSRRRVPGLVRAHAGAPRPSRRARLRHLPIVRPRRPPALPRARHTPVPVGPAARRALRRPSSATPCRCATRRWPTTPTTRCSAPTQRIVADRRAWRRRPRCGTCSRSRCSCSAATRSSVPTPPVVVVDTWDGYAGERQVVLDAVGAAADNLIVLTGDFHSAAVAELRADPFDPSLPVVGTEFMASSISSSFFDDDETVEGLVTGALTANPAPEVVRRPARLHRVRGHPRPMARHLPCGGRPVRRGVARHDDRFVGSARRCPRRARGVVTSQRRWRPQCGHGRAPRST